MYITRNYVSEMSVFRHGGGHLRSQHTLAANEGTMRKCERIGIQPDNLPTGIMCIDEMQKTQWVDRDHELNAVTLMSPPP